MRISLFCLLIFFCACTKPQSYYQCIQKSFQDKCKALLYPCLNDPACAYQIDMNARHIKLDTKSINFPSLYLSNPQAIKVYECLRMNCQLPVIDESYIKTLPLEYCMFEVYDICGGQNMEEMYHNYLGNINYTETNCYRKYCGDNK